MFEVENLNEFINRMFDNAIKSKSDVKEGLTTFKKYLKDTSMCDDEYLKILDKIIDCSFELLELKKKMNSIDVVFFIEHTLNNQTKTVAPKQKKKSLPKSRNVISDSCGSRNVSSSRYESTYSNSCGGGSYTSRC